MNNEERIHFIFNIIFTEKKKISVFLRHIIFFSSFLSADNIPRKILLLPVLKYKLGNIIIKKDIFFLSCNHDAAI